MLNWTTLVSSRDAAFERRGTEIEFCCPAGFRHRFAIYSVRTIEWIKEDTHIKGGYLALDMRYRVRDAETVTDAEVKEGIRPKVFGEYATLDEALAAIAPHAVIEEFYEEES